MENKVLKLGGGRSTQDVYAEIKRGNSERWTIQSQKSKYVNGKLSGVIEDKNGNAFSPNYNLPSNSYFTIKTTGLGSYTLTKVSTPSASSDTPILSSRFNPTKRYPLDLNFYWAKDIH